MNNGEKNKRSYMGFLISIIVNGMLSALTSLLLVWLISTLIVKEILPEYIFDYTAIISVSVGSLVSGFISAKSMGRALLTSFVQGITNLCIMYFAGLIVYMRIIPQSIDTGLVLACIVGAVAGGVLAALLSTHGYKIKK